MDLCFFLPATHHTTLVVGYAMAQTGNILIAVIFGVIAHFIGLIFGMMLNTDCGTHIDPPAVCHYNKFYFIYIILKREITSVFLFYKKCINRTYILKDLCTIYTLLLRFSNNELK